MSFQPTFRYCRIETSKMLRLMLKHGVRRNSRMLSSQAVLSTRTDSNRQNKPPIKFKETKLKKNYYKRYENYAPQLYDWSQKVIEGELQVDTLVHSKHFQRVSRNICDTLRHSDKNILNLVKSVLIMNLDPNSRLVQFLEDELLLKIRATYDLALLSEAYQLYLPFRESSPKRAQIIDALNLSINEKLDNSVASLSDLIRLIRLSKNLTLEILIKIEDQVTRILDSDDDISLDNLCYLVVQLSRFNRRNKPLIRAVVSKLLKYRSEKIYSMPPHLINMISSLSRLNFPEVNLLEKCSDILIQLDFLENIAESSRRDFTVAISKFNFSYPKLLDYYLLKLSEKPDLFVRQDLVALTIMLARLNYHNEEVADIVTSRIVPKCGQQEFTSKYQWFNYVYSLLLLRCATPELVQSIMNQDFYKALEAEEMENNQESRSAFHRETGSTESPEFYSVMNVKRKFCSIYGMLLVCSKQPDHPLHQCFEHICQEGEFLNLLLNVNLDYFKKSKDLQNFHHKLIVLLESFAPSKDKYMAINLKTPFGFHLDAELSINSDGKPQTISDPGILFQKPFEHQLDPNSKRVAIVCIGFNDTLLDSTSRLIGPKASELQILRSLGYVVVPVHQNSMPTSVTLINRVKFLQNLIADQLKSNSSNGSEE